AGGLLGHAVDGLINDAAARFAVAVQEQCKRILPPGAQGLGQQVFLVPQFARLGADGADLLDIGPAGTQPAAENLADQRYRYVQLFGNIAKPDHLPSRWLLLRHKVSWDDLSLQTKPPALSIICWQKMPPIGCAGRPCIHKTAQAAGPCPPAPMPACCQDLVITAMRQRHPRRVASAQSAALQQPMRYRAGVKVAGDWASFANCQVQRSTPPAWRTVTIARSPCVSSVTCASPPQGV